MITRSLFRALLTSTIIVAHGLTPKPSPTAMPVNPSPSPNVTTPTPPPPTPTPTPIDTSIGPQGSTQLIYRAGQALTIDCAPLTFCIFRLHRGEAGITTDTLNTSTGIGATWALTTHEDPTHPYVAIVPSQDAQAIGAIIATNQRIYPIMLVPNPLAKALVYTTVIPDANNVVHVKPPQPYTVTTAPPATLQREHCPQHYRIVGPSGAPFWPKTLIPTTTGLSIAFPPHSILPTIGVPDYGNNGLPPDPKRISLIPVSFDVYGKSRVLHVSGCYQRLALFVDEPGQPVVVVTIEAQP